MKDFFNKLMNGFRKFINFLKDTRKELRSVSWPTWSEVKGTTLVVIAAIFFFGFYLAIVDFVVHSGTNAIFGASK
jgi:preprotein translocase subunit SecE